MSHSCCDPKPTPEPVKAGAKDPANCTASCTDGHIVSNAVSHSNEHSGCHSACCHDHHESHQADSAAEVNTARLAQGEQHQWQILGMDCASCARKVETAVSRVSGVCSTRVVFATEKLLVELTPGVSPQGIVDAVHAAGFKLKQQTQAGKEGSKPGQASRLGKYWQPKYWQPLSLALLMLLAALAPASISTSLFTLATVWGLLPIARKAWALIRSGTPFAIETLMTVAAIGAMLLGETAEAAMVLLLFMLGEQLESFAAGRARAGVSALMALVPDKALRLQDGQRQEVAASELRPGDIIDVAPGARLPADAELLDASAAFDESALTGESIPVERVKGERVAAGCLAADRLVKMKVVSEPGSNAIDRILHLIEEAEGQRAPIERFIDKFSRWYTPAIMLLALLTVLLPPLLYAEPWEQWIYRGLTLLLIGCPCALVISTPAAVTSALAAATRQGALIKGGAALEALAHVDTVAFDKTGTLTEGKPEVTLVESLTEQDATKWLRVAAAIELGSHHPLAQAIVNHAKAQQLELPGAEAIRALPGMGVEGRVDSQNWRLLAPSRLPSLAPELLQRVTELEQQGQTLVVLCDAERELLLPVAIIALRDQLRAEAAEAIAKLRHLGIDSVMLTGDNPRTAKAIAEELAIDWRAGLLPEDKVSEVAALAEHRNVAMTGDGINDAPAMKRARIGIAMGGGTDAALETADAALTHNQLGGVAAMIHLARATLSNIRQNIALALGLKAIFLVTSLLGITGLWLAVMADTGATVLVTANALRLLRKRY
ncbi:zinc/cadmium/mercury/lead-transporting ATPase [Shewanella algae]|uniref:zinc/cadmium/mercury/lead-transporting ATPase n=1 Tax=Shewanella algae TaxID=38313 RepID=UPI000BB600E9|nr:zinc/cadmium/mercury/lead-transporting ATPase [Shewanella algae]PBQ25589.1 zinc/cadmium/mercury/lead-transporting ATPase [Shewanella algae]QNH97463.1 zinc/cadmium/mercury/lead-transporting ATPase [Shewanella algae]